MSENDSPCPVCGHPHLGYLDEEACVSCGCYGPDEASFLLGAWRRIRTLVDAAFNEHLHDYDHELSPDGDTQEYESAYDYVERVLKAHEKGET